MESSAFIYQQKLFLKSKHVFIMFFFETREETNSSVVQSCW